MSLFGSCPEWNCPFFFLWIVIREFLFLYVHEFVCVKNTDALLDILCNIIFRILEKLFSLSLVGWIFQMFAVEPHISNNAGNQVHKSGSLGSQSSLQITRFCVEFVWVTLFKSYLLKQYKDALKYLHCLKAGASIWSKVENAHYLPLVSDNQVIPNMRLLPQRQKLSIVLHLIWQIPAGWFFLSDKK